MLAKCGAQQKMVKKERKRKEKKKERKMRTLFELGERGNYLFSLAQVQSQR